ncbi:hypothetical protein ACHAWU_005108 [Discostella pseudostelligera]|uniref:Uncharacterized protein n=1 Tax=Discostella pseudostelligera TaxID=259834 RepID=A0ABD3M469_9STRA
MSPDPFGALVCASLFCRKSVILRSDRLDWQSRLGLKENDDKESALIICIEAILQARRLFLPSSKYFMCGIGLVSRIVEIFSQSCGAMRIDECIMVLDAVYLEGLGKDSDDYYLFRRWSKRVLKYRSSYRAQQVHLATLISLYAQRNLRKEFQDSFWTYFIRSSFCHLDENADRKKFLRWMDKSLIDQKLRDELVNLEEEACSDSEVSIEFHSIEFVFDHLHGIVRLLTLIAGSRVCETTTHRLLCNKAKPIFDACKSLLKKYRNESWTLGTNSQESVSASYFDSDSDYDVIVSSRAKTQPSQMNHSFRSSYSEYDDGFVSDEHAGNKNNFRKQIALPLERQRIRKGLIQNVTSHVGIPLFIANHIIWPGDNDNKSVYGFVSMSPDPLGALVCASIFCRKSVILRSDRLDWQSRLGLKENDDKESALIICIEAILQARRLFLPSSKYFMCGIGLVSRIVEVFSQSCGAMRIDGCIMVLDAVYLEGLGKDSDDYYLFRRWSKRVLKYRSSYRAQQVHLATLISLYAQRNLRKEFQDSFWTYFIRSSFCHLDENADRKKFLRWMDKSLIDQKLRDELVNLEEEACSDSEVSIEFHSIDCFRSPSWNRSPIDFNCWVWSVRETTTHRLLCNKAKPIFDACKSLLKKYRNESWTLGTNSQESVSASYFDSDSDYDVIVSSRAKTQPSQMNHSFRSSYSEYDDGFVSDEHAGNKNNFRKQIALPLERQRIRKAKPIFDACKSLLKKYRNESWTLGTNSQESVSASYFDSDSDYDVIVSSRAKTQPSQMNHSFRSSYSEYDDGFMPEVLGLVYHGRTIEHYKKRSKCCVHMPRWGKVQLGIGLVVELHGVIRAQLTLVPVRRTKIRRPSDNWMPALLPFYHPNLNSPFTIKAHRDDAVCVRYNGMNLNRVATANSDATVKVLNTSNGLLEATFSAGGGHPFIGVDIAGDVVCGCGADKTCRSGDRVLDIPLLHEGGVTSVHWKPGNSNEILLSNGKDSTLKVIDTRTSNIMHTFRDPGFRTLINHASCSFSPNGANAAAGSADSGDIFVWNVKNGEKTKQLSSHSWGAVGVAWGLGVVYQ